MSSDERPTVPGKPGSRTPHFEEPTTPREPLPPKQDQSGPRPTTPTGAPSSDTQEDQAQQGSWLTTAQGARLYDTDHSLKAGSRGPTLLQDHHLREKITHFDHERIPERVVHARGSAAHGTFVSYGSASEITKAAFLAPEEACSDSTASSAVVRTGVANSICPGSHSAQTSPLLGLTASSTSCKLLFDRAGRSECRSTRRNSSSMPNSLIVTSFRF